MEQSFSREANSHSASREIPRLLGTQGPYRVHEITRWSLSWARWIQSTSSHPTSL